MSRFPGLEFSRIPEGFCRGADIILFIIFLAVIIIYILSVLIFLYRCSILASSAYVALGLGDNVMALTHAQRLLSQSNLVGGLK